MVERLIPSKGKRVDPHLLDPLLGGFAGVVPAADEGGVAEEMERGRWEEDQYGGVGRRRPPGRV